MFYYVSILFLFLMFTTSCSNENQLSSEFSDLTTKKELSEKEIHNLLNNYSVLKTENRTKTKDLSSISYFLNKKIDLEILDSINNSIEKISIAEYLIKDGDKEGYSVVLNDNRFPIVIAYIPEGNFKDTLAIEPLNHYFKSIPILVSSIYQSYQELEDKTLFAKIGQTIHNPKSSSSLPLITTWHDEAPYNNAIDFTCSGANVAAGSHVAAMGQIMAHYKKPTYNWSRLLISSNISSTDISDADRRTEVARLYKDISKNTYTTYTCNGFFVSISDILKGFKTMGYPAVSSKSLSSFNIAQSTLMQEINTNKRPVLLYGTRYKDNKNMGDCYWVADGYSTPLNQIPNKPMFQLRINWGCGSNSSNSSNGLSNGYYLYTSDNYLGTNGIFSASSRDCFKNITAVIGIY